jgi:hypothetical protein
MLGRTPVNKQNTIQGWEILAMKKIWSILTENGRESSPKTRKSTRMIVMNMFRPDTEEKTVSCPRASLRRVTKGKINTAEMVVHTALTVQIQGESLRIKKIGMNGGKEKKSTITKKTEGTTENRRGIKTPTKTLQN